MNDLDTLSDKDIKDFEIMLNDLVYSFKNLLKEHQILQKLCNSQIEIMEKQRKIIEELEEKKDEKME